MKLQIAASCAMLLACSIADASNAIVSKGVGATVNDAVTEEFETWKYQYDIENTDHCVGDLSCAALVSDPEDAGIPKPFTSYWLSIRTFAVPYFSDAGITSITEPAGWQHEIVNGNTFGLLNANTLIWRAVGDGDGVAPGSSLSGFSYAANFGAGKGPFSVTNAFGSSYFGDPAIPLSPAALAAGISAVPEPTSLAMLLAGSVVSGLGIAARRKFSVRQAAPNAHISN